MSKTICIIGAFDTKGEDHAFVREEILKRGHQILTINIGVLAGTTLFPVDYEAEDVAKAGGFNLADMRDRKDKAAAMKAFDEAAPSWLFDCSESTSSTQSSGWVARADLQSLRLLCVLCRSAFQRF